MTQDHQTLEQLERDGAHHEQVQRSDAGSVIAQERGYEKSQSMKATTVTIMIVTKIA